MSKDARPWLKFYPSDWRSDPGLRMCGFAARGLWMDLLALMHEAEPYGHLTVNGKVPSDAQLAAMLGGNAREIGKLIAELEAAGVPSRTDDGTLYSRRLVRDREKSEVGRKAVERRWGGDTPNRAPKSPPNRSPNTVSSETAPKPNTQKPEARSQKPEREDLQQPDTVPRAQRPDDDAMAAAVIEAFDQAQAEVWGDLRRQQPTGKDLVTAHRWLRQGLDPGQAQAAFVEIFEALRERDKPIPRSLTFIDGEIADRIGQARDLANSPERVFGKHASWYPKLAAWYERQQWVASNWGPPPGQQGCQVPLGAFKAWEAWAARKEAA